MCNIISIEGSVSIVGAQWKCVLASSKMGNETTAALVIMIQVTRACTRKKDKLWKNHTLRWDHEHGSKGLDIF